MLTEKRLVELLDYNFKTGIFVWRDTKQVAGTKQKCNCIRITIDGKNYLAHRLAWLYMRGSWPPNDLDHKDLNRSNNIWYNIRLADKSKNGFNTNLRTSNKSGYRGVFYSKQHKKFRASVRVNGKAIYLGLFDDPEEASRIYNERAKREFGEFYRDTRC